MALKSTDRRVDELELNKQDNLVSGVNIKTINGNSVLGSGNLTIGGGGSATWGGITGTLSSQTDLQSALDAKQDDLVSGTNIKTLEGQSLLGAGNIDLTKSDVGLSNVDNTSDLNKPISTATQTALNAKEDTITAGTTSQYYRGDKTFQTLDKTAVGLGNVDNTSDLNKPISTLTQTALNAKQDTLTLTTTGTSGAATLVGATLNIPQYSGGGSSNFSVISISATNSTAVTGTTANAIVSSILVPANTFVSNGIIDIAARYLKTGTASSQNVRMYVNTSSSLTGATLVANFYNGANTQVGAWRTANISSNTINFLSTLGIFSSDLASIAGTGTSAPFNTSVNNFIIFAVQLGNGLDSCVLQFHKILRYA
jgi:hypothetical protein